jgi:leucyl-tRNA synthetase
MVLLNAITKEGEYDVLDKKDLESLVKLLNPFAPHMASELWSALGNKAPLDYAPWPTYDAKLLVEETFTLVIQVNGRVRGSLELPRGVSKGDAEKLALGDARVKSSIGEAKPTKVIFIPNRLINFVL